MMGATCGEGTAYPFGNLSSPPFSVRFLLLSLVFVLLFFGEKSLKIPYSVNQKP
jgi:hypothetical protein